MITIRHSIPHANKLFINTDVLSFVMCVDFVRHGDDNAYAMFSKKVRALEQNILAKQKVQFVTDVFSCSYNVTCDIC